MSQRRHGPGGDATALQPGLPEREPLGAPFLILFSTDPALCRAHPVDRSLLLGRDESCDVRIEDDSLSRMHARIFTTANGIEVEDLGSANGTYVGGGRITRTVATMGSLLRFGGVLAQLRRLDEQWRPATSAGPLVGGSALE